jgi:hypothetical protein
VKVALLTAKVRKSGCTIALTRACGGRDLGGDRGELTMHYRMALLTLVATTATACSDQGPTSSAPAPSATTTVPADAGTKPPDATAQDAQPNRDRWMPPPDQFAPPPDGNSDAPDPGCGLNTRFAGDEQCILPPPPDLGFQVHIGPSNYEDPEPEYVLQPGAEDTQRFAAVHPNDADKFFYYRQYRMRRTAHHVILDTPNNSGTNTGRRIGTANTSQDFPVDGVIAPEDQSVGMPIAGNSPISVDLHAINTTGDPQLREVWVNFWYRDPSQVTEVAIPWFETGDMGLSVPPRASKRLGPYNCDVRGDGRLLWLYGHRHANNVRFNVVRVRGTQRDVIYDSYHWEEPLLLEYNSRTQNRAPDPDPARKIEGGWSGILDLRTGDRIEWLCDIVNQTDVELRFRNETLTGEMCIVDAEAVGSDCIEPRRPF